jgi:spore coat protein U-like protein
MVQQLIRQFSGFCGTRGSRRGIIPSANFVARRRASALLLLMLALLGSTPTWAATQQTSFLVTATVISVCTITATPMAFGNYSPLGGSPTDATSTITITCTQGAVTHVGLDNGANFSGGNRRMMFLTSFLNYQIYKDSNHATLWGNSTPDWLDTGTAPSIAPRNFTAYGRITAAQDVPIGAYLDTVTATVDF